jgi:membrane protease YdiL (CAAX protease family)
MMLLTAIVCLLFFLKKCRIKDLITTDGKLNTLKSFLTWACSGILFMSVIVGLEAVLAGKSVIFNQNTFELLVKKLPWFIFCAVGVGIIEEVLFRGVVLRLLYATFTPVTAILFSSIFFAYLHTKIPLAAHVNNCDIGPWSGFRCLVPMLFGFLYEFKILQFAKLVLFGIILSVITLKNKSLIQPIGFHFGVVLALFSFNLFV